MLIGPDGGPEAGTELWKKWLTSSPIISDRSPHPPPPPLSPPPRPRPHSPPLSKIIPCLSSIRKNKKDRLDLGNGDGDGDGYGREGNNEIGGGKKGEEKYGRVGGYDDCDRGSLI